jgi:nitrate/nitrite transporter NarK
MAGNPRVNKVNFGCLSAMPVLAASMARLFFSLPTFSLCNQRESFGGRNVFFTGSHSLCIVIDTSCRNTSPQ